MEPLVAELGRSERREGAVLYVEGLLTPGQRKSVEPMASRDSVRRPVIPTTCVPRGATRRSSPSPAGAFQKAEVVLWFGRRVERFFSLSSEDVGDVFSRTEMVAFKRLPL